MNKISIVGCMWCNGPARIHECADDGKPIEISGATLVIDPPNSGPHIFDIRFCPMCGRKLKFEEKEKDNEYK